MTGARGGWTGARGARGSAAAPGRRARPAGLLVLIGLLLAAPPASAGALGVPQMDAVERGALVTSTRDGAVRWTAEWTLEQTTVRGERAVRFTETGRGRYSPFDQEVRWTVDALWTAEGVFSPRRVERRVTDASGRLLVTERKVFDFTAGVARFERQDFAGGRSTARELKVPPDTLTVEGIGTALRALPFDPPRPVGAHLLTNEPRLYEVTFEPRERERVRTPAGAFDCYKVELVPHLGLLELFRVFVPRTYFWLTAGPPHSWVRYEGLEAGLGTPRVVLSLAKLEGR